MSGTLAPPPGVKRKQATAASSSSSSMVPLPVLPMLPPASLLPPGFQPAAHVTANMLAMSMHQMHHQPHQPHQPSSSSSFSSFVPLPERRKPIQKGAWTEVFDDDDATVVWYYNRLTRLSQWEKPDELKSIDDFAELVPIGDSTWLQVLYPGRPVYFYDSAVNRSFWQLPQHLVPVLIAQEERRLQLLDEQAQAAQLAQEQEDQNIAAMFTADATVPEFDRNALGGTAFGDADSQHDESTDDSSDVSSDDDDDDDDDDDEDDPLMKSMLNFKAMLREHNLAAFASWDAELPKFANDPRFLAIKRPEFRRRLFDEFVKMRADEIRDEKANAKRGAIDRINELMRSSELGITARTAFEDCCKSIDALCERDAALRDAWALLGKSARETAFRAVSDPLREARRLEKQKLKDAFLELLGEHAAAITPAAKLDDIKSHIRDDPRYANGVLRSDEREELFREYVKSRATANTVDRTASTADALRRVEQQRAETQARRERELEAARRAHRSGDAEENFLALLQERDSLLRPATDATLAHDPRFGVVPAERRAQLWHEHRQRVSRAAFESVEGATRERLEVRENGLAGVFATVGATAQGEWVLNGRDWSVLAGEVLNNAALQQIPRDIARAAIEAAYEATATHVRESFDRLLQDNAQPLAVTMLPPFIKPEDKVQFEGMMRILRKDKRWGAALVFESDAALQERAVTKIRTLQHDKQQYDELHAEKRPTRENVRDVQAPVVVVRSGKR
jgi:hypothetical protein